MGTRANTVVIETGYGKEFRLINIYRQFDGYPSGHGLDLCEFISGITLCDGIGMSAPDEKLANGAGCFAAQLVAHFKNGPGGIYIDAPSGKLDNDYTYLIRIDTFNPSKGFDIEVRSGRKILFRGNPEQFAEFIEKDNAYTAMKETP